MAKTIDPILPILSMLGYWAIVLGSFGGPGGCCPASRIGGEHLHSSRQVLCSSFCLSVSMQGLTDLGPIILGSC